MRTHQWIRAGNGIEAVGNMLIFGSAFIWVPIVVVWLGVQGWQVHKENEAIAKQRAAGTLKLTGSDCADIDLRWELSNKALRRAKYATEVEAARQRIAAVQAEVNKPNWSRDCAPVRGAAK